MNRKHPLFLAALALLLAIPARAEVFTPNDFADTADGNCDSHCSLRDAVLAANARPGFDFILLKAGTYSLTLGGGGEDLGAAGDLDIRDELTIAGDGAARTFIERSPLVAAIWNDRVIDVHAGVHLELEGVSVQYGFTNTENEPGGGIRVAGELHLVRSIVVSNAALSSTGGGIHVEGDDAVVTVVQSTIFGNVAKAGGGAYVEGTLNLTNSTLSNNGAASGLGSGIYFVGGAGGTISNSTIAFNTEARKGGGIYAESAPFASADRPVLRNTILAGNTAEMDRDCSGPVVSGGHNLLGDGTACIDFGPGKGDLEGTTAEPLDPRLDAVDANGGPTPTQKLFDDSPARGKGAACEPQDQRGADRSVASCDIGAVEATSRCVSGGSTLCLNNGRFQVKATWRTSQSNGNGSGVQLTDDSGYIWFFDPANVELTVKVLDGCGVNSRYWVFLGGLTNVGVEVTVTDTLKGITRTYGNPLNTTFAPILATNAFNTCP